MNFRSQYYRMLVALAVCLLASSSRAEDVQLLEEAAFKAATNAAAPFTVRIETFGGQEKVGNVLVGAGPTTGVIVSEDGYILSSAFNFAQKPSSILVTLADGKRQAAKIVARDHSRMLVLLKIEASDKLPTASAVPRDEMAVGQWAIALGRTFDQAAPNVSVGVLSAKNRIWGKALQCDAKISPSNYGGPLVDLQGRVFGILVPMSPTGQGEMAGAEWYDSGIGFAVPLADVLPRLEQLKSGQDLHPGLLGIALKGNDIYTDPALLITCQRTGPAAQAGLKAQDRIIEIDGQPIERQAQLKHALGPKYAGETVQVVALRGEERVAVDIKLIDKLAPYEHPFLGVLPLRLTTTPGVTLRYVYPEGPAALAQLQAGDRIVALDETEIKDTAALADALAASEVGKTIVVKYLRGEEARQANVTLGSQPNTIPAELPAAFAPLPKDAAPVAGAGESSELKIPEEKNEAVVYLPKTYQPAVPHGVLLVLCEAGKFPRDELVARYQPICDQHGLILLLARSADPAKWEIGDAAFLRKSVEDVAQRYAVDRQRIAVLGYQTCGAMAYATALSQGDLFRGIIAVEGIPPQRLPIPENDPAKRVSIYNAYATRSPQKSGLDAAVKRWQEMKYPLVVKPTGEKPRDLNAEEIVELGRWLDSLDRL